jgi:N-acetylglutamate synthase-like GNAT family acetyltransferase
MRRLLLPFLVCFSAGCGHPATVKECEAIVEHVARLELEETLGTRNDNTIKREIEDAKRALKESTLKDCVGKRITKSALECVRTATSAKIAVEDCFD